MLEGLYSAAAGMAAQQQRLDALSNDVANVSTSGYKRTRVAFRDLVYGEGAPATAPGVTRGAGAAAEMMGRGFAQGALRQTERPLDVAIEGRGFFQVRRPDGGVGLTRDGSFSLDASGALVTASGGRLEPAITVPRGTSADDVAIAPDGTVSASGRRLGRIELVTVPATEGLTSTGDGLFSPTAASGAPAPVTGARLTQGAIEASNVDLGDAMVDLMDAQRSFQLASRAIEMQDRMMEIANGVKR